jgi:hypothetical protein
MELPGLRRSVREGVQAIDDSLVVCMYSDFLQGSFYLGCVFKGQGKSFQFSIVHNLVFTNVEDLGKDFSLVLKAARTKWYLPLTPASGNTAVCISWSCGLQF